MSLRTICEIVRDAETNYTSGTVKLSEHVEWSMNDTIQRIDAYLNSRHTTGATDSLGRDKPFFNIVTAATNIWYRATDIDRKDIRFVPTTASSIILAFIANVILQNWMNKYNFGKFLNTWGRGLSKYGSAVSKFIEKDGELIPSVIPWNRVLCDQIDFDALPRIEKFYLTPAQLRQNTSYDQKVVDAIITGIQSRKTIRGLNKDKQNDFIELYEVHGELDTRLLDDVPNLTVQDNEIKYRQQMHVVCFIQGSKKNEYVDYTLYKGKEARDPYSKDDLIEEDGRTLAIGAVEYLFDAQWMKNHTVKNMKDTLDIASKLIFQTSDARYSGRNVLSAIETGDIFVHEVNMPLTRVANDKPDVTALQNFGTMWESMAREITSTPDAMRGNTMPSGTPYALGQMLAQQSNSLFEIMTENKGLAIEQIIRKFVIPHLKKQLKHSDEIMGILDDAGIKEIDAMYIPNEAIKRHRNRNKEAILAGSGVLGGATPQPFNPKVEQGAIQQELTGLGNKRFFKPDDLGKQSWDEILSDFQWDNIRVEITNENHDKQAVLTTLDSVLKTIASNPAILQDPNAKMIFNQILLETGRISPLQLTTTQTPPASAVAPGGGAVGAGAGITGQ